MPPGVYAFRLTDSHVGRTVRFWPVPDGASVVGVLEARRIVGITVFLTVSGAQYELRPLCYVEWA